MVCAAPGAVEDGTPTWRPQPDPEPGPGDLLVRVRAADLPYDFRLDDRNAMNPQARLSQAASVVMRARISKSGQAQAQSDDWGAEVQPVKPGARGVQLVINQTLGAR